MNETQTTGDDRLNAAPGRPARPRLCVVSPCFNEQKNLRAFHQRVADVLDEAGLDFRFLLVDDGSDDDTPAIMAELRALDPRLGYVRLARNFGLQSALAAGLGHAAGDVVVVMDADLQDDPAAIPRFIDEWRAGADVVYAIRSSRREGLVKRAAFRSFYRIMSLLAEIPIPRDAGSFALYDRRVVDRINQLPERNRYLPGLRAWVGFRQVGVEVPRRARHAGEPAQSFSRLARLAFDGVFAFSKAPLRLASFIGLTVTALSALALLLVLYWRFVERSFPSGVGLATIALALLFLGGVQLLVTGIIGEYLGRVYDEVKRRPNYVVMETHVDAAERPPAMDRRL